MGQKKKENIALLKRISESSLLSQEANAAIDRTLQKIQAIEADKTVKAAILGEFSSGKSTFINAMLKENVLSYGDEPTTAVNTIIRYGTKSAVEAVFGDGKTKRIQKQQIQNYLKENSKREPCRSVVITEPNSFLKDGLVIVDTPGANIDLSEHNIQRKRAIDECSVGIFLISCQSLTSDSFIRFLTEHKDSMQKVMFVVTKIDLLEEEDSVDVGNKSPRQRLVSAVQYVTETIKKYAGVKKPAVYAVSAKAYLDKKQSSLFDVNGSFEKILNDITLIAMKDKEAMIRGEIDVRLKEISALLHRGLECKELSASQELNEVSLEMKSFDRFLQKIQREYITQNQSRFVQCRNKIREKVMEKRTECYDSISKDINRIDRLSEFKDAATYSLNKRYQEFHSNCSVILRQEYESLVRTGLDELEGKFNLYMQDVKDTYQHLGILRRHAWKRYVLSILGGAVCAAGSWYLFRDTEPDQIYCIMALCVLLGFGAYAIILSTMKPPKFQVDAKDYYISISHNSSSGPTVNSTGLNNLAAAGGAAVIGGIVGGPIGAIIGAGVGSIFGDVLFHKKLCRKQDELLQAVWEDLIRHSNDKVSEINSVLIQKEKELEAVSQQYIEANVNLHQKLLNGIEEHNRGIFRRLSQEEKLAKSLLKELEQYISE